MYNVPVHERLNTPSVGGDELSLPLLIRSYVKNLATSPDLTKIKKGNHLLL